MLRISGTAAIACQQDPVTPRVSSNTLIRNLPYRMHQCRILENFLLNIDRIVDFPDDHIIFHAGQPCAPSLVKWNR